MNRETDAQSVNGFFVVCSWHELDYIPCRTRDTPSQHMKF